MSSLKTLHQNPVTLRPWREDDVEPLHAIRNDEALQNLLMARAKPNSLSQVREWLERKSGQRDAEFFIIADAGTDQMLGFIQIDSIDSLNRVGNVGVCIAPEFQGRGAGTAALDVLQDHARDSLNVRKLTLSVLADNEAAISVYRNLGFSICGRWTDHHYVDGRFADVVLMEKHLEP